MRKFPYLKVFVLNLLLSLLFLAPGRLFAQNLSNTENMVEHIIQEIIDTLIFAGIGLLMMVVAFKVKDWLMPGDLAKQLIEDKNVAMGIVTAAFILGVSIIIAAAIHS